MKVMSLVDQTFTSRGRITESKAPPPPAQPPGGGSSEVIRNANLKIHLTQIINVSSSKRVCNWQAKADILFETLDLWLPYLRPTADC